MEKVDIQNILQRLSAMEEEIRKMRELICASAPSDPLARPTEYPHIESVPDILSGEPVIKGTRTPVRAIVEHWKFGEDPIEIARQLPHLRLAHVFDALAYYDDHRDEIERHIQRNRVPVND